MAIKRYFATKDTTITNAYKSDLVTAATGSNAGRSDILEVFSIYGQASAESVEKSRVLIQFDAAAIKAASHPASAKYYLNLFNAEHAQRLPREFQISVMPVISEWEEGAGLDLINYSHSDEASWVGRTSDRIAQVVNITLTSVAVNHYASKSLSLFDGQDNKFNFFFKTAEETSSAEASGTDVEVDISALAAAPNERHRITLTIPPGAAVAASSVLRIVLDGAAVPGVDVYTLEVALDGQERTAVPGLIKAAVEAVSGAALNGFAAAIDNDGEDAATGALSNLQVQIIGPAAGEVFTVSAIDEPAGLENITTSTHLEAIEETIPGLLTTAINGLAGFTAVENAGVVTVTNVIAGESSTPLNSSEWLQEPTMVVSTPGSDYTAWTTPGGDFDPDNAVLVTQAFDEGTENLEVDITTIVNQWIADADPRSNFGLGIMLSSSYEDGTKAENYYTKRFFARDSEFFFKRPVIEARWNSALKDGRGSLLTASPFRSDAENKRTFYLYNYENGQLKDFDDNVFAVGNATKELFFTLTTDKALSQKVTLPADSIHYSVLDSPSEDYTKNAYVEFEISNSGWASAMQDSFRNTIVSVEYTDPESNAKTKFPFIGYPGTWNAPDKADIYRVTTTETDSAVDTPDRRQYIAADLVSDMNSLPGFSNYFFAEAVGQTIRIYSKISGDAGKNVSAVVLHHESDGAPPFAKFISPSFDSSEARDTETNLELAAYATLVTGYNSQASSAAWATVPSVNDTTCVLKSRAFAGNEGTDAEKIKCSRVTTGTYKAEFKVANNISTGVLYEKWWVEKNAQGGSVTEDAGIIRGHSGSSPVIVNQWYNEGDPTRAGSYSLKIMNLQNSYTTGSLPRLRLFIRERNTTPNLVSKNTGNVTGTSIENVYYKVQRMSDGATVIPYGTGSEDHTLLSYDKEGNHFDLDMSMFERDYSYGIKFLFMIDGQAEEQKNIFKFRVD